MMIPAVYFVFFIVCIGLIVLAFRPAWQEWRSPTDCSPLPISNNYTSQVDHFAIEFRREIAVAIATAAAGHEQTFDHVPLNPQEMDWSNGPRPAVALHSLDLQHPVKCLTPLYVNADLSSIGHDVFSGVFADGQISLGPNSEIREWVHAEGPVSLGASCIALRRISSGIAINLEQRCCFERLHAPTIRFGSTGKPLPRLSSLARRDESLGSLPGAIRRTNDLYMIKGDCVLPRHCKFTGSLIVTGHLIIGAYTIVVGDIKARKGLSLGTEALITGSVVSENEIKLYPRATVGGLVISETSVFLAAGSVIGTPSQPSTVSAEAVIVEAGAIAHGTVWAREVGTVWST